MKARFIIQQYWMDPLFHKKGEVQTVFSSYLRAMVLDQLMDYHLKNLLHSVLFGSLLLILMVWLSLHSKYLYYHSLGLKKSTMLMILKFTLLTLIFLLCPSSVSECQLNTNLDVPQTWGTFSWTCPRKYNVVECVSGFKFWLCFLLAVWPWRTYLTFLCIRFFIVN